MGEDESLLEEFGCDDGDFFESGDGGDMKFPLA